MNIEIESNTRVTLNFSLSLENGEEVDSNFGADPVSFVMGDGSLLPGFERRLLGMRPGDEAESEIQPHHPAASPASAAQNLATKSHHPYQNSLGQHQS